MERCCAFLIKRYVNFVQLTLVDGCYLMRPVQELGSIPGQGKLMNVPVFYNEVDIVL